jgi:integrase
VRAWRAWAEAAGLVDGPAFRQLGHGRVTTKRIAGDGIARMLKRRATAAGLDPEMFSGHSLRSGFATTAARAGVAEHKIMRQGRWTTSQAMRELHLRGRVVRRQPVREAGAVEGWPWSTGAIRSSSARPTQTSLESVIG